MKNISIIALAFAAALSATVSAIAASPVIVGYYMGEMPVSKIPATMLTHVIYSFGEPGKDNVCHAPTAQEAATFAQLRALRAAHPQLHVTISIGGWSEAKNYSDVALTAASRAAFAKSCVEQYVVRSGFEGIDIDWEFPVSGGDTGMINRPQDRANVTALLQELRRQLDELQKKLGEHDEKFAIVFEAIRQLMAPPAPEKTGRIGFQVSEPAAE